MSDNSDWNKCKLIKIKGFPDNNGGLSVVESTIDIPFDIKRIYYLYDVKEHLTRGFHAHKELYQLYIPINGEFDVELDDGYSKKIFHLDDRNYGLFIKPITYRKLYNFSKGSICLVLASQLYSEDDYIRDYEEFLKCDRVITL
jgi:hypothetical protein